MTGVYKRNYRQIDQHGKNSKFIGFCNICIKIIFGIILLGLGISSIVYTCVLCDTESVKELTLYNRDSILKYVLLIILYFGIMLLIAAVKKRKKSVRRIPESEKKLKDDKFCRKMFILHAIMGFCWVICTQLTPRADQGFCSAIGANLLVDGYDGADFLKGGYLNQYPFQSGIILVFRTIYSLFGINNYIAFQFCNVCALLAIDIFMGKILEKMKIKYAAKIYMCFMVLFFPLVFYTSFLYGNLMGCAFAVAALYFEYAYFEDHGTGKMIISSVCIGMAVLIKSNYLIMLLAMLIFLVLDFIISLKKKNIVFIIVAVLCYMLGTSGPVALLSAQQGVDLGDGVPKIAWIAMGMQETQMAPGWYNGYNADTFLNNDCDSKATSEQCKKDIQDRVKYFSENPEYTVNFYVKKMLSQWCEPTFGGIWINQFDKNIVLSKYMESILNGGKHQKRILFILDILESLIYWLAFAYVIQNRKNRNIFVWIPGTAFIGGFIFHMIWEAKGQYTFTYFILLIPYAASAARKIIHWTARRAEYLIERVK